jgi:hypothetical protein
MIENSSRELLEWISAGNTGCLFAAFLAKGTDTSAWWRPSIYAEELLTDGLAAKVENDLIEAAKQFESAQLVFPSVRSAEQVAKLLALLCRGGRMFCQEVVDPNGNSKVLQLGIRFCLPDEKHVSNVMAFANLDTMPATRRAPVTALVLRLGAPGRFREVIYGTPQIRKASSKGRSKGLIPVHLADIPIVSDGQTLDDETIKLYAERTGQKKSEKLEADLMAAGATLQISVSLPAECRDAVASALVAG